MISSPSRFPINAFPTGEDYETLGGLIFHSTGNVPEPGETIEYGNYRLTVKEVTNRRVGRVQIARLSPTDEESQE